jgi:hypothetical protein
MIKHLQPKHPLQWTIVLGLVGSLIILLVGKNLNFLTSENVKILTGFSLFTIMLYQAKLFLKKLLGQQINRNNQNLHRWASYAAIILFLAHLTGTAAHWYLTLLLFFFITVGSAYFARAVQKQKRQNAIFRQIFVHTLFGAATLAAAIPHAIIAISFE